MKTDIPIIQLNKESTQSKALGIFKGIKIHSKVRKESYRLHDAIWCETLAEGSVIGWCSFYEHEQQQWAQAGLDCLGETLESPEELGQAWLADKEAQYLLRYYVIFYLKEWVEDYAIDVALGKDEKPKGFAEDLTRRFIDAWIEIQPPPS